MINTWFAELGIGDVQFENTITVNNMKAWPLKKDTNISINRNKSAFESSLNHFFVAHSTWGPLRPPWEIPPGREAAAGRHTSGRAREELYGKQSGHGHVKVCDSHTMWHHVQEYSAISWFMYTHSYLIIYNVSFAPWPSSKARLSLTIPDMLLTGEHVSSNEGHGMAQPPIQVGVSKGRCSYSGTCRTLQ